MEDAQAVANGAEWLDENYPGWVDKINLDALNMTYNCIADMAVPDGGFDKLFLEFGSEWTKDHAFSTSGRDEWVALVNERREAKTFA